MGQSAMGNQLKSLLQKTWLTTGGSLPQSSQEQFNLALKWAQQEYFHPECESERVAEDRRSFCFHHNALTEKVVLLIHGFTACPFEMRELGQALFDKGYNVYGVRLAGHGTSARDLAKTNAEDWKASVERGLAIAVLLGKAVTVIGESMGGALAVLLAKAYPEIIERMILCAPCFKIANPLAYFTTWALFRKVMPTVDMGVNLEWQRAYWYQQIPTSALAELVRLTGKARKAAGAISIPVLLIQAKDDTIVQWRAARIFYQKLSHLSTSEKSLRMFEPGHHNLTIDLNPQKNLVFEWIFSFI